MIDVNIMPFAKLMGVRLKEAGKDRVVAEIEVRADLCTTNNIMHGGAYMAFADTVGAVATVLNLPKGAGTTTIESKTNFLGSVREGETARSETTPIHIGRTTQVWQTKIFNPAGKLVAVVTQTQMVLPPKG